MYSSTPSLTLSTTSSSVLSKSVLAQFPPDAAHAVVTAVVKSVSNRLGIGVVLPGVPTGTTATTVTSTNVTESASATSGSGLAAEAPALNNESQITWFMEASNLHLDKVVFTVIALPKRKGERDISAIIAIIHSILFFQVVCHGLSLPLAEHDTIKDCVNIYCEWLSALMPVRKPCIPQPIVDEPNRYARKIIGHLYHLFVPRKAEGK